MVAEALGERRGLIQFHWGGGTPTFLSEDEIRRLFEMVTRHFAIESGAEVSLEADARVTTHGQVALLRSLGFNRLSMGVQDLDPSVQEAIGRNQSEEQTRRLYDWGREAGFTGINFDLVYGLPGQTMDTWTRTIENVIDIGPDRLAVYSFAFLPERLHNQRRLDASALPTGEEKYALFAQARRMFVEAGYRAIGMDHFALPTDDLSAAMDERRLHRNFMGYTSMPVSDMVGIGLSSIGEIGGCYAQNEKRLTQYYKQLDGGKLPVVRGWTLSDDDTVRRWVIRQLMCNFYLDFAELKRRFGVAYEEYFAEEEAALAEFYANEFVARDEHGNIKVLPLGQVFVRNVAMVFDAYLKKPGGYTQFSRTV